MVLLDDTMSSLPGLSHFIQLGVGRLVLHKQDFVPLGHPNTGGKHPETSCGSGYDACVGLRLLPALLVVGRVVQ